MHVKYYRDNLHFTIEEPLTSMLIFSRSRTWQARLRSLAIKIINALIIEQKMHEKVFFSDTIRPCY